MKKALSLALTLLMVITMCLPVFAGPGRFITSPSGVDAPELIESENSNDACNAKVVITAFADRHTLDDATRQKMEKAYNDIVNATDLANLNADLAALAKTMKIDSGKLAVSDLFDISYVDCADHDGHGYFTITLKPETVKNFVGLMHLNGDNWELVKDAKVEGNNITFTVEELSPFAIVVDTSAGSPITGDFSNVGFYVVLMAVSAIALILIVFKLKKRETN
jgi:hypothetical protein